MILINVQHCIHFCATRTGGNQGRTTEEVAVVVVEGAEQCCQSPAPSPMHRVWLDDHRRLSQTSLTTACACVQVCECVFLSTFLPFLYLSFVVFWLRLYN